MKNNNQLGIYIHIPFCVQKCVYCDFLSASATKEIQNEYIRALFVEIRLLAQRYKDEDYEVDSIFIGGGTPSVIEPELIDEVLLEVRKGFNINEYAEITIECNPGTLSENKAFSYRNSGINRISFGLQSCDNKELKMLGRIHTIEEFRESFSLARNYGFNNINIDIMTGLPGQNIERLSKTVNTVLAFKPEHISAYGLIIEEGTPLFNNLSKYPAIPDDELDREMYAKTSDSIKKAGYKQYEISNYAKPGYECVHNLKYWECKEYLGFGIGAASFINKTRYSNIRDIKKYIATLNCSKPDVSNIWQDIEHLTVNDAKEEFVFLGLRKIEGISITKYKEYFDQDIYEQYKEAIESNINKGLLILEDNRLKLTRLGIDVSNSVMSDFII